MRYGWEGEHVRLVPLDASKHLDNALRWMNDPETTRWLLVGDRPLTRLAEEEYFQEAMKEKPDEVAFAIELLTGEHIGFCGLHRIEFQNGAAVTGTIIGPPDQRGKGYGRDAIRTRTRYAFDVLGLRMLRTEVFAENAASLRALLRNGYREYGRLPGRYWKRGAYRDAVYLWVDRGAFADACANPGS